MASEGYRWWRLLALALVPWSASCSVEYGAGQECVRDTDCPSLGICAVNGHCLQPGDDCDLDDDCAGKKTCDAGTCVPAATCETDGSCPSGQICNDGICVEGRCSNDAQCAEGWNCAERTGLCESPGCTEDDDCPTGTRCDSRAGECREPFCAIDADCDLDEACEDDVCVEVTRCDADEDCPADFICSYGERQCIPGDRDAAENSVVYGPERCDGADNDRDGEIDELWADQLGSPCEVTDEACAVTGTWACAEDGHILVCDAPNIVRETETCNDLDDDCDGQVDEDFSLIDQPCTVGKGECEAAGIYVCADEGMELECSATAGEPTSELCDELDNDCDGQVDEDFPSKGLTCSIGLGACAGTAALTCSSDGSTTECNAVAGTGADETCNAIDDDCDGEVDENLFQDCESDCGSGTEVCAGGTWVNCSATQPSVEICNNLDDDCDGETDEGCDESWTGGAKP